MILTIILLTLKTDQLKKSDNEFLMKETISFTQKYLALVAIIFFFGSCEFSNNAKAKYFIEERAGLIDLKNSLVEKEKISLVYRREFLGILYRLFNIESIEYKVENYKYNLIIDFRLSQNFQNEDSEIKQIINLNKFNAISDCVEFSSENALAELNINKEELILIFQLMKNLNVVNVSRFKEDTNALAFLVNESFYLIYSTNISKIKMNKSKHLKRIEENWYSYDRNL